MRTVAVVSVVIAMLSAPLVAQEKKPVPKDSVRLSIPGCSKGYIFTAARRTADAPGSADIAEGTHFRMNVPKKIMTEIKAHEGSMIEITGLIKKGDYGPPGIGIGGGVRIAPGPTPGSGGGGQPPTSIAGQIVIDVEGWRQIAGGCRR